MQMNEYILYVLAPYVQAGAWEKISAKTKKKKSSKNYILNLKEEEHAMLIFEQDNFQFFSKAFFFHFVN